MKNRLYFFALLALVLISPSCKKEKGPCLISNGEMNTKTIYLEKFKRLHIKDNIDVVLHKSSEHKAMITSGENILENFSLTVKNDTLFISDNNQCKWARSYKVERRIDLYMDSLYILHYEGEGRLTFADTMKADTLRIKMWTSGGVMEAKVDALFGYYSLHTGEGDFYITGKTDVCFLYLGGAGYIRAENLFTNQIYMGHKGTGEAHMRAEATLEVNIDYVGDAYYYQIPTKKLQRLGFGTGKFEYKGN